jgi:hypothetical protein
MRRISRFGNASSMRPASSTSHVFRRKRSLRGSSAGNTFRASCMVMVENPSRSDSVTTSRQTARPTPRASTPPCVQKRRSSTATNPFDTMGGTSSRSTTTRRSTDRSATSEPSRAYTRVASGGRYASSASTVGQSCASASRLQPVPSAITASTSSIAHRFICRCSAADREAGRQPERCTTRSRYSSRRPPSTSRFSPVTKSERTR